MRYVILFLIAVVALAGCATVHHTDPNHGLEVTYTGPAHGAAALIEATNDTDEHALKLAGDAVDKGMSTSVRITDDSVSISAGYGYVPGQGGSVGGFAQANTGFIPGQGFVTGPPQSSLPPLATSVVVTGVPNAQATGGAIVPCPTDRLPQTVPEQAACAAAGVKSLTQNRTK